MDTQNQTAARLWPGVSIVILAAVLFAGVPQLFANDAHNVVTLGYGDATCTAKAPNGLRAGKFTKKSTTARLSWRKVGFSNCDAKKPASYEVSIYTLSGNLVKTVTGVKKNMLQITTSELNAGKPYKFRVRAIAVDDTATEWSTYRRFKVPARKALRHSLRHHR